MLRKTRPSSQSYQVAAVWGAPLGLTVATTAGFGRARKVSTSGGTGTGGTRSSLLSGYGYRVGWVVQADLAHRAQADHEQGAHHDPAGGDQEVRLEPDRHRDRPGERVAGGEEDHRSHPAVRRDARELLRRDLALQRRVPHHRAESEREPRTKGCDGE